MGNTEAGGISGMMRELRLTLNEVFSGGKLEPEQELTVQVLFGLLGYLANIDSIVTDHEVQLINSLMDELELPIQARQRALEVLGKGRRKQIDVGEEITRYLKTFPAGGAEVEFLYNSLLKLAASDGRIRPREREFLQEVTVRLGYTAEDLETRLTRYMPTGEV